MSASMIVSTWLVRNKQQSSVKRVVPAAATSLASTKIPRASSNRRTGITPMKVALPFFLLPALAAALPAPRPEPTHLEAEVESPFKLITRDLVHKLWRHDWWPSSTENPLTALEDNDDNENFGLGFSPKLLMPIQVVEVDAEPIPILPPIPVQVQPKNKLIHLPGPKLLRETDGLNILLDDEIKTELRRLAAKKKAKAKAEAKKHHHIHHHHHHHHHHANNFHIPLIDPSKPLHYTVTSATGTRTMVKCTLRPANEGESKMSENMSSTFVNGERTTEYTEEATINGKVYHCTKKVRVPSAAERRKFMEHKKKEMEERRKKEAEKKAIAEKARKEEEKKKEEERKKKEEEEKKQEDVKKKEEEKKKAEEDKKADKKAEAEFKKLVDAEVQKAIDEDIINVGTSNGKDLRRRAAVGAEERGRVIVNTKVGAGSEAAVLVQANMAVEELNSMSR